MIFFYIILHFSLLKVNRPFADDRHHMNLLWNKTLFGHMRSMASTTIEGSQNDKLTQMRGPWVKSTKELGIDEQLPLPNTQLSNGFFTLYHDVDKLLPLKGTAAEVLNQGK